MTRTHTSSDVAPRVSAHSAVPRGTIAIIGLDASGMNIGHRAATRGFRVTTFDEDEVRIAQLSAANSATVVYSSDPRSIRSADVFLISVPIPLRADRSSDTRRLQHAVEMVARALRRDALVVLETEGVPGLSESLTSILVRGSRLLRSDIELAYVASPSPRDRMRPAGGSTKRAGERAVALYQQLGEDSLRLFSSLREAEAVRFAQDAYHDVDAALADELSVGFDRTGIDAFRIITAAAEHRVVMHPHIFGDIRVPADPYQFIRRGRKSGSEDRLLGAAARTIASMPFFIIRVLADALRQKKRALKRSEVALLGSHDAGGIETMRGSLEKRGATVRVFDPLDASRSNVRSLEAALEDAEAVVIVSKHPLFTAITADACQRLGVKVVVDAAHCLEPSSFQGAVLYRGLGR